MNSQKFIFDINEYKIAFTNLCEEGGHLYRYDPVEVKLISEKYELIIFDDFMFYTIDQLNEKLSAALNNNLGLSSSINKDIGFFWNEHLQETIHNAETGKFKKSNFWAGLKNLLWSGEIESNTTWIYTKNDSIYLEITPTYKWHHAEPEPGENFVSYEEWIKDYKPILVLEIPKEVALRWLHQTEVLIKEIELHDKFFLQHNS